MALIDLFQQSPALFVTVAGVLGLLVGSFLNVVIYRLPVMMERDWQEGCRHYLEQQAAAKATDNTAVDLTVGDPGDSTPPPAVEKFNLAYPPSRCSACDAQIKAWQNIPIISYLLLKGKCAHCKTGISVRYPIIEFITALLTVIVALHFGPSLQAVAGIGITWCLITLTMIDFDTQLLPDSITLPLMWAGLIASTLPVFATTNDALFGAAFGYLSLWSIYWLFKLVTGKEGMGYGDFKLLAALGAWLGWQALPVIILLSSVVGAVVGIALIIATRRGKDIPIPFGPYLATAGWAAMLWGDTLVALYGIN